MIWFRMLDTVSWYVEVENSECECSFQFHYGAFCKRRCRTTPGLWRNFLMRSGNGKFTTHFEETKNCMAFPLHSVCDDICEIEIFTKVFATEIYISAFYLIHTPRVRAPSILNTVSQPVFKTSWKHPFLYVSSIKKTVYNRYEHGITSSHFFTMFLDF